MGKLNLKKLLAWRERVTYKVALEALKAAGVSESMAQKVLSTKGYRKKMGPFFVKAINEAMERNP